MTCPKYPDPSKLATIQVQTLPLEGPMILKVENIYTTATFEANGSLFTLSISVFDNQWRLP